MVDPGSSSGRAHDSGPSSHGGARDPHPPAHGGAYKPDNPRCGGGTCVTPASPTQILLLRLTKWFQAQWGTHHPSAPGSNNSDSNGTNISRATKSPEAQAGTTGGICDTSGKGSEGCKVPILPEAAQQEKPKLVL